MCPSDCKKTINKQKKAISNDVQNAAFQQKATLHNLINGHM